MSHRVVITGIGLVTPLGNEPAEVAGRLEAGESAAVPMAFDTSLFGCRVGARIREFQPQKMVAESKMVRLMNRDAQLAVAAAHLALQDARLSVGADYAPQEMALFGATGLIGLPLNEVAPLVRNSVGEDGQFDLGRFGRDGLRSISPLLSFKVLGNMPVCFVSICENLQGPNAIYTPWEGQGAQAIAAGVRLLQRGLAPCALVGGCDVKTHELAFIALEQLGLFRSWRESGQGLIPGEGAVFLVLEEAEAARRRGARVYAAVAGMAEATVPSGVSRARTHAAMLRELLPEQVAGSRPPPEAVVAGADGDMESRQAESEAMAEVQVAAGYVVRPKAGVGNMFAAAAALQVAIGAFIARRFPQGVLAHCFGYGSQQAVFLLEGP